MLAMICPRAGENGRDGLALTQNFEPTSFQASTGVDWRDAKVRHRYLAAAWQGFNAPGSSWVI